MVIPQNPSEIATFDVAAAVGVDPKTPNYQQIKLELTAQLLAYILGRIIEDNLHLRDKVESYKQEFIGQVKNAPVTL